MTRHAPEHIIYPVGHHAAGKTELCNYLTDTYGLKVVETGTMVRSLYASRDQRYTYHSLGQYIRAVEDTDPGYFDRELAKLVDREDPSNGVVIINGMRNYTNIARAMDTYPTARHSVVWLEAPTEQLHERYMIREGKQLSREDFDMLLAFDMELGLAPIKEQADFHIENDSTLESLHEQTDAIMRALGLTAIAAARLELGEQ
ncbi:MAG TPA: AAA family ATPase [Candidatus Saccharimonadales bacterium]|nr:AAA family ATPase [Candidatus Saccharimonadales bacterium]